MDNNLVDIRNVNVDIRLDKEERKNEFIKQIRNVKEFMYDDIKVSVDFSNKGNLLEDCMVGIIL